MRRTLAASVVAALMSAVVLSTAQPVSAANDDFAGIWTTPDTALASGITLTIERSGADAYSVTETIQSSSFCGNDLEVVVDTAAVVVAGVLQLDLVVTECADGSIPDGTVLPGRTVTPQPDGTLLYESPVADLVYTRVTTEFFDVPVGRFYTDAVTWLASEDITTGTSPTTFSPDDPVTRAQMATFLWRYDGEPEPASPDTPFTDVIAGTFYAEAVAWLAEAKITTGTSPTTYSPGDPVTRAQMATFLWRYSGEPEPLSLDSNFTDVIAGSFYEKAVAWLVEQKITTGTTPTTYSPEDPVTRAQMATFLWRLAGEPAV
jgi:hypothetical protein